MERPRALAWILGGLSGLLIAGCWLGAGTAVEAARLHLTIEALERLSHADPAEVRTALAQGEDERYRDRLQSPRFELATLRSPLLLDPDPLFPVAPIGLVQAAAALRAGSSVAALPALRAALEAGRDPTLVEFSEEAGAIARDESAFATRAPNVEAEADRELGIVVGRQYLALRSEMRSFLGLVMVEDETAPEPPVFYSGGVLEGCPIIPELGEGEFDADGLRAELEQRNAAVQLLGGDPVQEFRDRIASFRTIADDLSRTTTDIAERARARAEQDRSAVAELTTRREALARRMREFGLQILRQERERLMALPGLAAVRALLLGSPSAA